jgi:hypothetical protein
MLNSNRNPIPFKLKIKWQLFDSAGQKCDKNAVTQNNVNNVLLTKKTITVQMDSNGKTNQTTGGGPQVH